MDQGNCNGASGGDTYNVTTTAPTPADMGLVKLGQGGTYPAGYTPDPITVQTAGGAVQVAAGSALPADMEGCVFIDPDEPGAAIYVASTIDPPTCVAIPDSVIADLDDGWLSTPAEMDAALQASMAGAPVGSFHGNESTGASYVMTNDGPCCLSAPALIKKCGWRRRLIEQSSSQTGLSPTTISPDGYSAEMTTATHGVSATVTLVGPGTASPLALLGATGIVRSTILRGVGPTYFKWNVKIPAPKSTPGGCKDKLYADTRMTDFDDGAVAAWLTSPTVSDSSGSALITSTNPPPNNVYSAGAGAYHFNSAAGQVETGQSELDFVAPLASDQAIGVHSQESYSWAGSHEPVALNDLIGMALISIRCIAIDVYCSPKTGAFIYGIDSDGNTAVEADVEYDESFFQLCTSAAAASTPYKNECGDDLHPGESVYRQGSIPFQTATVARGATALDPASVTGLSVGDTRIEVTEAGRTTLVVNNPYCADELNGIVRLNGGRWWARNTVDIPNRGTEFSPRARLLNNGAVVDADAMVVQDTWWAEEFHEWIDALHEVVIPVGGTATFEAYWTVSLGVNGQVPNSNYVNAPGIAFWGGAA